MVSKLTKQVDVALVVESIGEYRAKDSQSLDLVLAAKVDYTLQIQFNQLHMANLATIYYEETPKAEKSLKNSSMICVEA